MPTANDYRNVVASLRAHAEAVEGWWNEHGSGMDAVEFEAPRRLSIDEQRSLGATTVQNLLGEIEAQIRIAEFRAAVCEEYAEALRIYHDSSDPTAVPPPRPASWVSGGWW